MGVLSKVRQDARVAAGAWPAFAFKCSVYSRQRHAQRGGAGDAPRAGALRVRGFSSAPRPVAARLRPGARGARGSDLKTARAPQNRKLFGTAGYGRRLEAARVPSGQAGKGPAAVRGQGPSCQIRGRGALCVFGAQGQGGVAVQLALGGLRLGCRSKQPWRTAATCRRRPTTRCGVERFNFVGRQKRARNPFMAGGKSGGSGGDSGGGRAGGREVGRCLKGGQARGSQV